MTERRRRRGVNQRVHFRLIVMPCCKQQLCWVNPRLPNYCPECGRFVMPDVRGAIHMSDMNAYLRFLEQP